jgi:hypothetical protein
VFERLLTMGYAAPGSMERLEEFLSQEKVMLVDIRFSPRSRWCPAWNKKALIERTDGRYLHVPELGNRNYNQLGKPIELAGPLESARESLVSLLQEGFSVMLLCACKDYEVCHRKVVYELVVSSAVPEGMSE